MHAMVLPVRIEIGTFDLKETNRKYIFFSRKYGLSHSPMQAWSQSICMVRFKSICGMGEETRLCKLMMNLIIAHLLFGMCVYFNL